MLDPRQFLAALWGENPPGMINIWMLPDQKSYWYPDLEKVNRDMQQHLHEEVYTGVALAKKEGTRFNTRSRVKEVDAAAIPGVWSDIDVFHPSEKVHKDKILPGTVEQAQEVMAKLPHSPTLIVDSGHGLQYWWLLEEPWVFRDQGEWEQARRMTQWWHRITKELFNTMGWNTDSVFDLSRIMRLPGTFNNKIPEERKEVTVIKADGPRYSLNQFTKLVPENFEASAPAPEDRRGRRGRTSYETASTTSSGLVLDPNAEPGAVRLNALVKVDKKFHQSWDRNRPDLKDQSASSYNMSLADIAVRAGWPDQEVVNLMICWRRIHGEDLKLRERYYELTLAKAKESSQGNRKACPSVTATSGATQGEEPDGEPVSDQKRHRQRLRIRLTADEGSNIEQCILAVKALNDPPSLFSISNGNGVGVMTIHNGKIGMEVCVAERSHLELARRVQFTKIYQKDSEGPCTPAVTLMNLVHRALPQELPRFNGFKRLPFLWGKSLVTHSGYHAESGYYLDVPDGLDLTLPVPVALQIIEEFLGEFPFQGPADKANAFSVILGFPLKPLGNAPGLFVDKPDSQTGASLLCRCLGAIIEGEDPVMVTQGKSVGEFDKRAVAALKEHPTVMIFDNLNRLLDSDMAASGMTDAFFGGRLLGGNDLIRIPTRSLVLMFTANNLTATRELQNRCLRCRLDANDPSPETRTDFRNRLPDAVLTNRVAIVSAVSSIAQRWIEAECPQGNPVLGSFIDYTKAVSGLLTFAGLSHLDGNRRQMVTEVTPSWEALDTLVLRWWEKHADNPVPAIDLLGFAAELDLKGEDGRSRATSLTRRLGHALGQVFEVEDGIRVKLLESGRDEKGRAKHGIRYRLLRLKV